MVEMGFDILFLTDQLIGREEIQSLDGLIRRLDKLGHSVGVICRQAAADHGSIDLAEHPGLGRRWQRPWTVRGLGLRSDPDRPLLMHVLAASMADIGVDIAEHWGIPYLVSVEEFPRRDARLRLSRNWCRGLVATNPELAHALSRDFAIPAACVHQVARGVPDPQRSYRGLKSDRVSVVGAAGPLVAWSGFATFLSAARKVIDAGADVEFLIAGQGEDEAELRRRAERLRIAERLTFADEIPIGLTFWDVLDVYCQTSVGPTVGRPLTLAMASGVPAIASDVEGLRTLIKDGETGLLVPHGDAVALARAILSLLQDRETATRLGESGRQAVLREHLPDMEAERLYRLYRAIAREGLGPHDSGLANRATTFEAASGLDTGRVGGAGFSAVPRSGPAS